MRSVSTSILSVAKPRRFWIPSTTTFTPEVITAIVSWPSGLGNTLPCMRTLLRERMTILRAVGCAGGRVAGAGAGTYSGTGPGSAPGVTVVRGAKPGSEPGAGQAGADGGTFGRSGM